MSDIVERLRAPTAWARVTLGKSEVALDDTPFEAAKEIERLREIEWMYRDLCK